MKRFFCDHCGNELSYDAPAIANTCRHNDRDSNYKRVLINGLEVTILIEVVAQSVEQPVDKRPGWSRGHLEPLPPIKRHADLCAPCRWGLIERLRAGHPVEADTPFAAFPGELNWDAPAD